MTRRGPIMSRALAVAAAVALLIGVGAAVSVTVATQAAWNDKTVTSVPVTAGEWSNPVPPVTNSCTAWDQNGNAVTCAVKKVWFTTWAESPTRRAREYHVDFTAPNAKKIQFSVDLATATTTSAPESPAWSWSNAGVASSGQFTPTSNWTCSSLPVVTGQAFDWHTSIYFHVYENRTMYPVMCP